MKVPESVQEARLYGLSLVALVAGTLLGIAGVGWAFGEAGIWQLAGLLSGAFLLGKAVIFTSLAESVRFSPVEVALVAVVLDLWVAVALTSGLSFLERAPVVGPTLQKARAHARRILTEYPGLKRRAFWGVALFVFLPLAATGAVTGTFAARIVGLTRPSAVLAIGVGSTTSAAVFVAFALLLGARAHELFLSVRENPLALAAATLGTIVFVWCAWIYVKRWLRQN